VQLLLEVLLVLLQELLAKPFIYLILPT